MEEALRRAQMCIDAIKGCSKYTSVTTVKYYASELEKELGIIRKEVQRLNAPKEIVPLFGKKPTSGWSCPTKPASKAFPPPEEKK